MDCCAFLIPKTIFTMLPLKFSFDIVGKKGNNVAVAVLFYVDYSTMREFEDNVTESMVV